MTSSSVVCSLTPFVMMALGSSPQVDTLDPGPPTAIEQALTERACSGVASGRTFEADPHASAPLLEASPAEQTPSRVPVIIGGVLAIAVIAAGALVLLRNRRERRTCRECGAAVPDSGDLCSNCRHAAAEALRRVATE